MSPLPFGDGRFRAHADLPWTAFIWVSMAVAGRLLSRFTLLRGTLWRAILRACLCSTARLQTGSTSVFSAIKAATAKFTTVDKKRSDAEKNCALKQILDNAIIADGVADAFALAGRDNPTST